MIKCTTIESAAISFARISLITNASKKIGKEVEYTNFVKRILKELNEQDICEIGLLWNALTEKTHKDLLINLTNSSWNIHADSGGLQEITLGLTITEQDKLDIYERQSLYSTRAMSFDKMPILVKDNSNSNSNSTMLDYSSRYFVKSLSYKVGRESGYNLLEQCKCFIKTKKDNQSKILAIIQGSDFEDYIAYAKGLFSVFDELPTKERELYYSTIGGLSMGMSGVTNYFKMIDLYIRAPIEFTMIPQELSKEIHFLGVGGLGKVAPLFALQDNFFQKDVSYTFDSSSRTSSSTYGRFTHIENINGTVTKSTKSIGRKRTSDSDLHIEYMFTKFCKVINEELKLNINTIDEFRNTFTPFRDDGLRKKSDFIAEMNEKDAEESYLNTVGVSDFLHWVSEVYKFLDILKMYKLNDFSFVGKTKLKKAVEVLSLTPNYNEYMGSSREYIRLLTENISLNNINILENEEDFYNPKEEIDDEEW